MALINANGQVKVDCIANGNWASCHFLLSHPPPYVGKEGWISCNQTMLCTVNTYSTVNNLIRRKLDRVANRHARFQINKPFELFIYTPFESYKRFFTLTPQEVTRVRGG